MLIALVCSFAGAPGAKDSPGDAQKNCIFECLNDSSFAGAEYKTGYWAVELDYRMMGISRSDSCVIPASPVQTSQMPSGISDRSQMCAFKQQNFTLDLQWELRRVACRYRIQNPFMCISVFSSLFKSTGNESFSFYGLF